MREFFIGLLICCFITQASNAMVGNPFDESKDTSTASLTKNPQIELEDNPQSSHAIVVQEEDLIPYGYPSLIRRFAGYAIRGGMILGGAFIGGSIGFGITTSDYSYAAATLVVKMATPIFVGSLIGCFMGCGGGMLVKRKVTGRW